MVKLNIDFLIKTPINTILENIDYFFRKLLREIESYLQIEVFYTKITIILKNEESSSSAVDNSFSIGVEKSYNNEILSIKISSDFFQYIQFILLREAYKCFIPQLANQMKAIEIFINQKVAIDLKKLASIKEWNAIATDKLVDYEFISAQSDRLENFLKQEGTEDVDSPFKFFFKYIRKNIQIITEQQDGFYDILYEKYVLISSKSLYDDDIIETVRVLSKIFNRVQYFTAMLDYQHYFTTFKENGFIRTDLSLNKFTQNMQWIKNSSSISPNYNVNWSALNLYSINCALKFNPVLNRSKIYQIVKELPFFLLVKECRTNFGLEIDGFFVVPKIYFNDVKRFLGKLEENGYILQTRLTNVERNETLVNTNYLREYLDKKTLVNKKNKLYDKKYELRCVIDYGQEEYNEEITLLDWLIIDRIRFVSLTGFNFERRAGSIKLLKTDLINEIISQRKFITDLKTNLTIIHSSLELRNNFLEFLITNESFGFFYIKNMLNDYITTFRLIKDILTKNPSITSVFKFRDYFIKQGVSNSIENNISFKNPTIKKAIFNQFLPLYFKSRENFEEEINKYTIFFKVINSCYDLKIFNLKSIRTIAKNKSLLNTIFKSKEQKLKNSYENYKLTEINYQTIEKKLKSYLNHDPPVVKPNLIGNIFPSNFQVFFMLLKNNLKTIENLKKVSYISKKTAIVSSNILYVVFFIPYLNSEEKCSLISILTDVFKENLISVKRYLWSYFIKPFSRKDFYNLEQKEFFYSKDLFEQYFLNVRSILGKAQKPLPEVLITDLTKFWSKEDNLPALIKSVEDRVRNERVDFDLDNLHNLVEFNKLLKNKILDLKGFKTSYEKSFFKNYIKSINFIPTFQRFGMGQYALYFYPTAINKIDFKLLLNNSFQSISYPAQIDNSNSFLLQYISPYRNPGISAYLNWLTKSKKIVREYCLFFVKKMYQVFHFNYNLSPEGWDLDPNRFKIYFQNVLFNPDYKVQIPELKEFNVGDLTGANYLGPESAEFKALSKVYNWKSLDVKTYMTKRYFTIHASIMELLKKGLIQPFISLKNLDLVEEITIILPDVQKENNESILKIFSFFNIGFIYKIEGKYFIHGFEEAVKFENGIMIKLYFPDCQIDEFEKLFDLLFEYMEIDHYIILNDLIDGKDLIKSTFKDLKFLDKYNPLTNLIWNNKDKKWRNHKLFNEKFEPVYPDLFYGKKNYDLDS